MNMIELERHQEGTDRHEALLLRRVARMEERERALRALLLDARDAGIRRRVGSRPEAEPPAPASAGDASGRPSLSRRDYGRLRRRIAETLRGALPPGARTLFVSRGDAGLLEACPDHVGWHFPRDPAGGYAGYHPRDSRAAIDHLEELRARGAEFLVLPATALWWLEHYEGLAAWLDDRYSRVVDDPTTCVVHDLRRPIGTGAPASTEDEEEERPRRGGSRPLAAATIISRNYLAQARVLARTFRRHEPDGNFYVLVVDRLPDDVEFGEDVRLIDPEELDIPGFYEMCFKYGIVELNTSVKPFLLSLLLREYDETDVVYFDPDIMITRSLTELRDALAEGDIVLTPHITRPVPMDNERPSEQDIMISGAYNLGFIALHRSAETEEFLDWWQERLRDGCRIDVQNGLFTDQKWIDLVPSLFPSTRILRDPTYNVAFWNLHERTISRDGDTFLVNGRPAAFFHISGFDPHEPTNLSKHQTRTRVTPGTPLADLLETYAEAVLESGYEESSDWDYGYERFDDGTRVHPLLRQIYLNLDPEERRRFGDPFATTDGDSFLDWATRPRPDSGDLSRFLETVYRVRYDLPTTFPDVHGRDREAFLRWARRWGSAEMGFDPALVRDDPEAAGGDAAGGDEDRSGSGGNGAGGGRRATGRGEASSPPRGGAGTPAAAMTYEAVIERIRDIARTTLPAGSRVLVVSKGDYRLTDLGGSEGWHFPQTEDGVYGGYHPPNSRVAIAHLEALRDAGAGYLLIPRTSLWWLEYYEDFRQHLESRYRVVVRLQDTCLIYALSASAQNGSKAGSDPPVWRRWWRRLRAPRAGSGAREGTGR